MDGWQTTDDHRRSFPFEKGLFSGAKMLVSGSVSLLFTGGAY